MKTKEDLRGWVYQAILDHGGKASIVQVCKHVWVHHEGELRASGDLFFTWGYDIRWAAQALRDAKLLKSSDTAPKGFWEIAGSPAAPVTIP